MTTEGDVAPAVPGLAIQWDRSGAYVWKVMPDSGVERVAVAIVERGNTQVLVEASLADGDVIVYEGADRVRAGQKVDALSGPMPGEAATKVSARQQEPADGVVQ